MKCKISLLLLIFLMVLFSLPEMVWAEESITVMNTPQVINFQDEEIGEYTGDMCYQEENANYSIMEEAGTKFLRMSIPEGATGTPGLDLIKDREVEGEVTFEIRIRMSNFNNSGGTWQHNLRFDAITASGATRQILWSNTTDFCTGATITETDGTITDSNGNTSTASDGKFFYKTTSLANQWYRLKFTINPDTNKCYSAAYTDNNQFLGSAEWTSLTDFGSVVKGLRIHSPYTNTSNGTIIRRLDLDVSEIKITEESQSGGSEENWVTTVTDFEDETVGEYSGDMRYHEENANYSIMEEAGTKFLRMSIPEGATGTPGLDLIKDREVEGEVTFEIRIRMSNFNNSGGTWQHNLRFDAITASGATRQILWSNTTDFCTGATITETDGTITDSNGNTSTASDGKFFYKTTSLADQWYRLRFTINPDTNKCHSAAYTDNNQFLGSAEWTSLTDFGSVVKGLRIHSPYTNTSNGTITRRLDLDVSEIKITEKSQSGGSEENWVTTVTDFEDETVGEYTGELLYSTDNAEYSIGEDSGTKFLRMSIPEGAQGEPRVYLMRNQQMPGEITLEARFRTSNFVTIGGTWQAHLRFRVMDKQLFWMNQTGFTTGAGAGQYAIITDAEGATRQVTNGSSMYRPGSNFDNVWLRMKVEIDPDTGKTLTSFYDDNGIFIFSQDFILPISIPDRTVTECYFQVPYAWSQYGALVRRVDLDISEIKVSFYAQEVAPVAKNVSISKEGNLLTGNYTYFDFNEDTEQGSTYRFLRGTDLDDIENWEAVASGTCTDDQLPTYGITEEDYEQYIVFEVTPKAEKEPISGKTVRSEALAMPFAPVASDVEIQGGCVVGREVVGSYTYFDVNEGEEEQGSLYRWLISDSENGSYEAIDGATGATFAISEGYGGKYLKFEVTPKNGIDDDNSAAVTSEAYLITNENTAPTAANITIEGEAAVSSKLTGNYIYSDFNGDAEGESIYQWFVADTDEDEPIIIAQETGKELVVSSLFAEKYLYFQVTPMDEFGKAGTPVMSSAIEVSAKQANTLYVSLDGNDTNDGTLEHPFATLEKARDTIREWREQDRMPAGGITVYLRGGVYTPSQTFTLEEQDSGTEDAPIVYRPYQDEEVTISGGLYLDYSKFEPVSGEMKNRLVSEDAQNHVLVADLDELGIDSVEKYPLLNTASIIATPMFILDGTLLQLSRWPNESTNTNWPKMNCGNNYPGTRVGDKNIAESGVGQGFIVKYDTTRPEQWSTNLTDIIASGYWMYDWYAEAKYVKNIDKTNKLLESDGGTWYGVNTSLAKPFRFFNVYEEIDVPGEWYIDRSAGKMYLYPLALESSDSVFKMTKAAYDLISLNNASYVEFYNLEVTLGKENGIVINGGEGNLISNCNINSFEKKGALINSGERNGIIDSTIAMCGTGGMDLKGGDTYNIVPAENYAKNNVFHDFSLLKETYAPAIELNGVKNYVQDNEFYNSPHQALQFHGIDHIIEYNTFHDVCLNAADMGAIYTGRSLYDHDTVIRYNYFYNVGNQQNSNFAACGVFTDDGSSDLWVYGNIFGPGMVSCEAIKIHGGMRNSITNNIFIDIPDAIYLADRTDAQFKQWINGGQATFAASFQKSIANSVHMERWPWIKTFENGGYQYFPNTFGENVLFYIDETTPSSYYRIWNGHALNEINTNLVVSEDQETSKAYFEDYDEGNYTLTSAAYTTIRESIPDFEEIPFQAIGPKPIANQLPTVSSIRILGDPTQSTVLMGDYMYADKERDPEGISTYRWLVSDSLEGTYQPIAGATGEILTITDELSGKYVKFEVVPIDDQGNQGTAYLSSAIRIITD